jgi:2-oxoacid:acceptor oxidoreductase gamma subunit (pyruvate/2-ketoisovalerate family)
VREIRLHGRGGQGVVMASEILVQAFVTQGWYGNSIPFFGFERRGAPLSAFVRVDDRPIREKTQIYTPDAVLVLDASLLGSVPVFEGLKGDGVVVLNTAKPAEQLQLPASVKRLATVNANRIAIEIFRAPITNTIMLGAFAAATGWLQLESLLDALPNFFSGRRLEPNLVACQRGFREVQVFYLEEARVQ